MGRTEHHVLLIGAGGHALSCIDVIEQTGKYRIAGLIGLPEQVGQNIGGYKIIASDDKLNQCRDLADHALVTVGQIKSPKLRMKLCSALNSAGFSSPTVVSPNAYVSPRAKIGRGTIVMHGAIVNAGAVVGDNCIINSCSLIEHGSYVGDYCHIATMVVINGDCQIGRGTFVGSGSVLMETVSLGERCVVGMGSVVRCNYPANTRILDTKIFSGD